MDRMSNVIFYAESWGPRNVIKKEHETDKVPNVGEIVVLQVEGQYNFYNVVERVFDYVDNIVHLRISRSLRCYDLAVM